MNISKKIIKKMCKKITEVSICCDSECYETPKWYQNNMEKVPTVKVCLHCGREAPTRPRTKNPK